MARRVLRQAANSIPLLGAFAAVVGLGLAAREIARHQYVSQGLWRTSLWILGDGALTGALAGVAAGIAVPIWPILWPRALSCLRRLSRLPAGEPSASPPAALSLLRLAGLTAGCTIAAALLVPAGAPRQLPSPFASAMAASLSILWLVVMALAATSFSQSSERHRRAAAAGLTWLCLAGAAGLVVALRAWTGPESWRHKATVTAVTLLSCALAYQALWLLGPFLSRCLAAIAASLPKLRMIGYGFIGFAVGLWVVGGIVAMRARAAVSGPRRNVIIIGVDTLRADEVSLLSGTEHGRDLTPSLRTLLAARGTVFSDAITQAPWTGPAVASIFTGLYPEQHGMEHLTRTLRPDKLTLAEILREAGYRTLGVTSHSYVASDDRMNQGFGEFDESLVRPTDTRAITSERVTDIALEFLKTHRSDPFFLFVYYFDPHYDYRDHPESHFADGYEGWLRDEAEAKDQILLLRNKRHLLGPLERAYVRDLHHEEIAHTDRQVGRFLQFLDRYNLWDSTLVIFVGDHGEEFFERGWIGHTTSCYQELIHVPLVVAMPSDPEPGVVSRPVETRWIFGTVLDYLGVRAPTRTEGTPSLLALSPEAPLVRSSTRPVRTIGDHGTDKGKRVWISCILGSRWKLVKDHITGRTSLFDLADDPGETADHSEEAAEVRHVLESVLDARDKRLTRESGVSPEQDVDERQLERLRSLGYL